MGVQGTSGGRFASLLSFLPCWALGSPPVSVFGCWRVSLDIQLNRGPPGAAAFFGAGVCCLSGLFSSPGPGEGGVVSGELLALAFGSGRFGDLAVDGRLGAEIEPLARTH